MRVVNVDERDSTWERDDPRFRVYVFKGVGVEVTTVDVLDATIEQALESALALVDDDSCGMRGLVWLSGMDYNHTPCTARDWRRRGDAGQVPDGEATPWTGVRSAEWVACHSRLSRVGQRLAAVGELY